MLKTIILSIVYIGFAFLSGFMFGRAKERAKLIDLTLERANSEFDEESL